MPCTLSSWQDTSRWAHHSSPCLSKACDDLPKPPHHVQLIPEELVREYKRAMLNIHPALLPAFGGKGFYGSKVHKAVIASGARFSGPTIHFVDEGCAPGPALS